VTGTNTAMLYIIYPNSGQKIASKGYHFLAPHNSSFEVYLEVCKHAEVTDHSVEFPIPLGSPNASQNFIVTIPHRLARHRYFSVPYWWASLGHNFEYKDYNYWGLNFHPCAVDQQLNRTCWPLCDYTEQVSQQPSIVQYN
jgi:hypothetical protein